MNRTRVGALAVFVAMTLAACAPGKAELPDRLWDADGTLRVFEAPDDQNDDSASRQYQLIVDSVELTYYEDATLRFSDNSRIVDNDLNRIGVGDLVDGATVQVWTGACQESWPVSCEVQFLRVTSDA